LFSCQIIDKKVPTEQELFEKQIKEINWSEVDEYPSFLECDKISDNNQRKQCFFEFMATTIQQKLSVEDLAVLYPQLDTIEVKVTVFPDASLQFEPQFESDSLAYDKIKIDSILKTKLIDFPKVNPALKRGIPVKTEFILPVIIKSN
jgi:hypothetical protein